MAIVTRCTPIVIRTIGPPCNTPPVARPTAVPTTRSKRTSRRMFSPFLGATSRHTVCRMIGTPTSLRWPGKLPITAPAQRPLWATTTRVPLMRSSRRLLQKSGSGRVRTRRSTLPSRTPIQAWRMCVSLGPQIRKSNIGTPDAPARKFDPKGEKKCNANSSADWHGSASWPSY